MNPIHLGVAAITSTATLLSSLVSSPGSKPDLVSSLTLTAPDTNAEAVYLGDSTLNTSTLAGVIGIIQPGASLALGGPGNARLSWKMLYAKGAASGDKLIVVGTEVA